jgi:hypothetical protein
MQVYVPHTRQATGRAEVPLPSLRGAHLGTVVVEKAIDQRFSTDEHPFGILS